MMRTALALALATSLVACSVVNDPSNHQGGIDAGPAISPEEFCDELAVLLCQGHFHCCQGRPPMNDMEFEDCVSFLAIFQCGALLGFPLRTVLEDDRVGYDPHAAAQVVAEARERIQRCDLTIRDWYTWRDGLWRMLPGTIPPGEACTPRSENDHALLFACRGLDHRCLRSDDDTWTCAELGRIEDRCLATTDCERGNYCDRPPAMSEGTCRDLLNNGALCGSDDVCESFHCSDTEHRCRPPSTPQDIYCIAR